MVYILKHLHVYILFHAEKSLMVNRFRTTQIYMNILNRKIIATFIGKHLFKPNSQRDYVSDSK